MLLQIHQKCPLFPREKDLPQKPPEARSFRRPKQANFKAVMSDFSTHGHQPADEKTAVDHKSLLSNNELSLKQHTFMGLQPASGS
jgi:hypothetical protein